MKVLPFISQLAKITRRFVDGFIQKTTCWTSQTFCSIHSIICPRSSSICLKSANVTFINQLCCIYGTRKHLFRFAAKLRAARFGLKLYLKWVQWNILKNSNYSHSDFNITIMHIIKLFKLSSCKKKMICNPGYHWVVLCNTHSQIENLGLPQPWMAGPR